MKMINSSTRVGNRVKYNLNLKHKNIKKKLKRKLLQKRLTRE